MRASIFFFAFALFALVSAQNNTDRFIIDDFTVNQGEGVLITLSKDLATGDPLVIQGTIYFDQNTAECTGHLIGCGRNMRIEVSAGQAGRLFTSQIFSSDRFTGVTGEWDISNPKGGASVSYNLYDGNTADFTNINVNGLGAQDFTEGGLATGLRFAIISDLTSTFTVSLYDTTGAVCQGSAPFNVLPGVENYTLQQITTDIPYSSFSGACNKLSIGAVEIQIPSVDAVDATVYQIRGVGFPNPSATPTPSSTPTNTPGPSQSQTPAASQSQTPSQTPGPSQSNTPAPSPSNTPSQTPGPSQSRTPAPSASNTPAPSSSPSATPSNSGPCIIFCKCPSFTCVILYETSVNGFNDIDFDFVPGESATFSDDDDDTTVFVTSKSSNNSSDASSLVMSFAVICVALAMLI